MFKKDYYAVYFVQGIIYQGEHSQHNHLEHDLIFAVIYIRNYWQAHLLRKIKT
jgi:hypothetical protein